MKFIVLGTSDFTQACAKALIDSGVEICALISMPEELRPNNSTDLSAFAARHLLPYHEAGDINDPRTIELVDSYNPDFIFSSWPRILCPELLRVPNRFCIGTHPTTLPNNRGRHPLHWLIVMGIQESSLSFFVMDEGIDTGNILLQVPFSISNEETIGDVVEKVNRTAYEGTIQLCKILSKSPEALGDRQNETHSNYWRKRTPHDVTIDPRMSAEAIIRTVRSFTAPYPMANLVFRDMVLKVIGATMASVTILPEKLHSMEPGKILAVDGNRLLVKAEKSVVELELAEPPPPALQTGKYLHPPTKYLLEHFETISNMLS